MHCKHSARRTFRHSEQHNVRYLAVLKCASNSDTCLYKQLVTEGRHRAKIAVQTVGRLADMKCLVNMDVLVDGTEILIGSQSNIM